MSARVSLVCQSPSQSGEMKNGPARVRTHTKSWRTEREPRGARYLICERFAAAGDEQDAVERPANGAWTSGA